METLVGTGLGEVHVGSPTLDLGKHGSIRVTREGSAMGRAPVAFASPTVRPSALSAGSSKTAATSNLQDELRNRAGERTMMLSAGSRFADAGWLRHRGRRSGTTCGPARSPRRQ